MKNNVSLRRSALTYTALTLLLTVIALFLRLWTLVAYYDTSIGYFASGTLLPILSEALIIASVVAFAVLAILFFRKKETAYEKQPSLSVKIASAIVAALSLLLGVYDLKAGASVLALFFCLGACLYFLLVLTAKVTPVMALVFGFCVILRLLLVLAAAYTDFYVPMNSPEKVWLYVGIVAAMFFLVSEIRALVTKPYTATYLFSAASAVLVTSTSAIALIVGSRASIFYGESTDDAWLVALLLLAIAVYAGTRLVTVALNPLPTEEITESTEITEIEESPASEETNEPDQQ